MPTFNTFVKQVEINSGGGIRITVLKQTLYDNGDVHDHPHQITIETTATDEEIAAHIAANNAHLNAMGYPSIDPAELEWPMNLRAHAHEQPLVAERRQIEFALKAKREKDDADQRAANEKRAKDDAEASKKAIDDMIAAGVAAALKQAKGK